jgi:hypothetical protein
VSALAVVGSTLYSASYDCTIRQWSLQDPDLKTVNSSAPQSIAHSEAQPKGMAKPATTLTEDEERELAELLSDDE